MVTMFVNTGRAASRVCYLATAAQSDVFAPSRHHLDAVVTSWVAGGDQQPVVDLAGLVAQAEGPGGSQATALTLHGTLPRLALPFGNPTNVALLEQLRDTVGVAHVVALARDINGVLLSEWNRQLALHLGDWRFPAGLGWQQSWQLADLARLPASISMPEPPPVTVEIDEVAVARSIAARTGRTDAVWNLFLGVFPDAKLVDYRTLVDEPGAMFDAVGHLGGFMYRDRSLINVRLNGLSNRFLTYNPVNVNLGGSARPQVVQLRFELTPALQVDRDWGRLLPTGIDCTEMLGPVADRFDTPISIGIDAASLNALDEPVRQLVLETEMVSEIAARVAPVFASNFLLTEQIYREQVYVDALPTRAQQAFDALLGPSIESWERTRGVTRTLEL